MKTIEITVSPQGQTRIETRGFAGESCRQASQFVEAALGNVINESLTGEYYSIQEQSTQNQIQQGGSQN